MSSGGFRVLRLVKPFLPFLPEVSLAGLQTARGGSQEQHTHILCNCIAFDR
jgi:hypothetical protein